MKTLIVYAGNQEAIKSIAEQMKEDLGKDVDLVNLKDESDPSIEPYQRIIIGGSAKGGQVQKRLNAFCTKNLDELLVKETGLFICSMEEGEAAKRQLMDFYPEELYNTAKSTAIIKSGIDYSRMNFFEKMLVRKVKRLRRNSYTSDYEGIQKFSRRMDRVFNPFLFLA